MILVNDTTQTTTLNGNSPKFRVNAGEIAALRSTNLDSPAVVTLYYHGPDGTFTNAVDDNGTVVRLNSTNKERLINVPGTYSVQVDTGATTKGVIFVNQC